MNRFVAAAGALLALGLTASVATAAPLSGVGKLTAGANADLVQVHGMHRECVRGRWGWHRSTPWGGRLECRPQWQRWDRNDDRGHYRRHDDDDRSSSHRRHRSH